MFRIINVLTLLLASGVVPASSQPPDATSTRQEPEVKLSVVESDAVEWARGRFATVGLDLPDMVIEFDSTGRACRRAEGRYRYDGRSHRVAVCTRNGPSFRADLERRRTLLHEFAHVWETVTLSDRERERFMSTFGLDGWNDPADRWEDRGAERFAEVFVLALLDQPLRQLKVPEECAAMLSVFIQTTGSAPLGPGAPECTSPR